MRTRAAQMPQHLIQRTAATYDETESLANIKRSGPHKNIADCKCAHAFASAAAAVSDGGVVDGDGDCQLYTTPS